MSYQPPGVPVCAGHLFTADNVRKICWCQEAGLNPPEEVRFGYLLIFICVQAYSTSRLLLGSGWQSAPTRCGAAKCFIVVPFSLGSCCPPDLFF